MHEIRKRKLGPYGGNYSLSFVCGDCGNEFVGWPAFVRHLEEEYASCNPSRFKKGDMVEDGDGNLHVIESSMAFMDEGYRIEDLKRGKSPSFEWRHWLDDGMGRPVSEIGMSEWKRMGNSDDAMGILRSLLEGVGLNGFDIGMEEREHGYDVVASVDARSLMGCVSSVSGKVGDSISPDEVREFFSGLFGDESVSFLRKIGVDVSRKKNHDEKEDIE